MSDDDDRRRRLRTTTTTSKTTTTSTTTRSRARGQPRRRCARAKTVVELVARHLVDDPDGVFVDATERCDNVAILIHTSPGDLGRIIGKRGRVIQALRQVGRAAGATEDVRVTVEVAE